MDGKATTLWLVTLSYVSTNRQTAEPATSQLGSEVFWTSQMRKYQDSHMEYADFHENQMAL